METKEKMNILIACEMSGIVRDKFIDRGHNAISVDILLCDKPGPHYWGDVRDILDNDWDLIIAFPPCTYLANSGSTAFYGRRYQSRIYNVVEAARFFNLFVDHPCKKKAIENPKHHKWARSLIKTPYTQEIQPFQFGHPYRKLTRLWLFGLPNLVPTNIVEPIQSWVDSGNGGVHRSAKNRSLTFEGVAQAMAQQWG